MSTLCPNFQCKEEQHKQCTYIRNIDMRSRDYFSHVKALSMKYSECVSVDLFIQHAVRMRHIVICGLSGCNRFFHTAF